MTNYNYLEAMTADVLDYIEENIDLTSFTDADELEAHLNNDMLSTTWNYSMKWLIISAMLNWIKKAMSMIVKR